ncbi:MAG: class I SAM-dependent methyltransferase [Thaumarchaeota archaeon]|nr:class I SAM-dependent methyltransferase [Nitrososphaerota archaeon]
METARGTDGSPRYRGRYDKSFWDEYARSNESRYDAGFAGRVAYTAGELRCASVLEVGCGTGVDLRLVPDGVHVFGLDPNHMAVGAAREGVRSGCFARGMITDMPFADSSIDLVFTHRLLNYLDEDTLAGGMREMYRVARKHVMSCEWSGAAEGAMDGRRTLRNMAERWAGMGAEVMADAPVYDAVAAAATELGADPPAETAETRMTLVRVS